MSDERSRWESVADEMSERLGGRRVEFGRHISYWFENSPRRALYSMSYYKFAAKLIGGAKRVLDIGCGEGLGTWLLAKECGYARGVDLDEDAIGVARRNWDDERIAFECVDFLTEDPGTWNAITNFDVIEHILPEHAEAFLSRIVAGLAHDGIAVVGTPSLEGQRYASEISRTGTSTSTTASGWRPRCAATSATSSCSPPTTSWCTRASCRWRTTCWRSAAGPAPGPLTRVGARMDERTRAAQADSEGASPHRVLGAVGSWWDARRSRVERIVEARPFDPAVGAEILAGARENLRSTAGVKLTIDAGERWQFFLDRIRGDVEGFQTVREAIAYAQSAVDFDHRERCHRLRALGRVLAAAAAPRVPAVRAPRSMRRRTRSGRGRPPSCGSAESPSPTSPTSTCAMR